MNSYVLDANIISYLLKAVTCIDRDKGGHILNTDEDFDYYSPDDIEAIKLAESEINSGNCVSFSSADELFAHFSVS